MKETIFCLIVVLALACSKRDVRAPPDLTHPLDEKTEYRDAKSNFTFMCQAHGSPAPWYQWFVVKGGSGEAMDVMEAHSPRYVQYDNVTGKLSFKEFAQREEGRYFCHASNQWGVAVSGSVDLKQTLVDAFPKAETVHLDVKEGEPISFPCTSPPLSQPPARLSWFKSESLTETKKELSPTGRLSVDRNCTLHISHATRADSGFYACAAWNKPLNRVNLGSETELRVANIDGEVSSRGVRVTNATKYILAEVGQTTWLECYFSARPEVTVVSWFHGNNTPLLEDARFKFADITRHSLSILDVREEDEGWYTCQANNNYGGDRARLFLNVTSKPMWTRPLASQTAKIGDDVIFTCGTRPAKNERPIEKPQWFRDAQPLNDTAFTEESRMTLSENGVTLTIRNVSRDLDLMCLQCWASNSIGAVSINAFLNVLVPTVIAERPPSALSMLHGDIADVTVKATTDPSQNLTFTWLFEGRPIHPGTPPLVLNASTGEVTLDSTTMKKDDWMMYYGQYVVLVSHQFQTVNVTFFVLDPHAVATTVALPATTASVGGLWWIALIVAAVIVFIIIAVVVYMRVNNYPRQTYLLGKKEEKSNLDPKKDLESFDFQRI